MTKKNGKQPVFDEAFRREAVRILATGGRTVRQVSDDLGVGFSTLNKWKTRLEEAELMAGPHDDVMKELARLRRRPVPAGSSRMPTSEKPAPLRKFVVCELKA